jgi:predicted RNA-binding protein YlxR (DUF448 family)
VAASRARGTRRVPARMCVSCRTSSEKRELIRIVQTPEGKVEVDETGKRPGRGAYLCRRQSCWEAALGGKKDPVGFALRASLSATDREALMAYGTRWNDKKEV